MVLIRQQDAYLPLFFFFFFFFFFQFLISHLKAHSLVTEMQMMYMSLEEIRPGCVHVQSGQPGESPCPELSSRQTVNFFTLHVPSKFVQPG